jgi:hypothetical protein
VTGALRSVLRTATALLCLLVAPAAATAAPVAWTGPAAGGSWSTPGNWSGGVPPTSADDVTIAGAVVEVSDAALARTIRIEGTAGSPARLDVAATGSINIGDGADVSELVLDHAAAPAELRVADGGLLTALDDILRIEHAGAGAGGALVRLDGQVVHDTEFFELSGVDVVQDGDLTAAGVVALTFIDGGRDVAWTAGTHTITGAQDVAVEGASATFHLPDTTTPFAPDLVLDHATLEVAGGVPKRIDGGILLVSGTVVVAESGELELAEPNDYNYRSESGAWHLERSNWHLASGAVVRLGTAGARIDVLSRAQVHLGSPAAAITELGGTDEDRLFGVDHTLVLDHAEIRFGRAANLATRTLPSGFDLDLRASELEIRGGGVVVPGDLLVDADSSLLLERTPCRTALVTVGGSLDLHADAAIEVDTTTNPDCTGLSYPSDAALFDAPTRVRPARATQLTSGIGAPLAAPWQYALVDDGQQVRARLTEATPPTGPTGAIVSSHVATVPSRRATIDLELTGATDEHSGLQGFAVVVDEQPATIPGTAVTDAGIDQSHTVPRDGSWYVHVRAVDNEGNATPTGSTLHLGPFVIDTTGPAAPVLTGAPSGSTAVTRAQVSVATEAGATLQCSLDAGAYVACTSPLDLTFGAGAHTLRVRGVDALGNVGTASETTWTTVVAPAGPVAPRPGQIAFAGTPPRFAALGRTGVLRLRLPVTEAGVRVTNVLRVNRAQARLLGLRMPRGATSLLVGSGSATSRAAGSVTVDVRLSPAAKLAFRRLAASSSRTPRAASVALTATLAKGGATASTSRVLTIRR